MRRTASSPPSLVGDVWSSIFVSSTMRRAIRIVGHHSIRTAATRHCICINTQQVTLPPSGFTRDYAFLQESP